MWALACRILIERIREAEIWLDVLSRVGRFNSLANACGDSLLIFLSWQFQSLICEGTFRAVTLMILLVEKMWEYRWTLCDLFHRRIFSRLLTALLGYDPRTEVANSLPPWIFWFLLLLIPLLDINCDTVRPLGWPFFLTLALHVAPILRTIEDRPHN